MNLSEMFIRRPVMTTLVMLGILLFGIMAFRFLPVSDLPNVDYPTITVSAALPGASPETMASSVATPLERQFSTIAGLESMSSSNTQGSTQISLQFALSRNIDAAAQDVQSMITQAEGQLPPDMPSPPTFRKVNPADQPIIYMAVWSDTLPLYTVSEYADTLMAQRISMVSGVAQVRVFGERKYAVRVQFDPKALATRQIGIDEAVQAIQSANVNLPTGTLYGTHKAFVVQAEGQLNDAAAYRPVIIAYRNGAPVRLDQVADVINGSQTDKIAMWFGDHNAMVLAIQRQPGTNTVEVVDNIRRLLPTFQSEIPASIHFEIQFDRSEAIRDSINDVKSTLYLTLCLVILVIFLFLRNISATLIPSLALPMSIIGTFAVMYLAGYTVDNLSLMALVLAVGFVVDDAIVMLENIVRHMELGETVMEAALNGSKEISFTILSMTLSLTAVFIPVLFMSGIMGRLLHEFAVTIVSAVLVSGLVSLTLTPMLCSRFLRHPGEQKHGRLYQATERYFNHLIHGYDWSLRAVLRHRLTVLIASILILIVTGYLLVLIPKGFLPSEDSGGLFAFTQAAQGTSFDQMKKLQKEVSLTVRQNPNVESVFALAGAGGPSGGGNSGIFFCRLKDHPPTRDLFVDHLEHFFHIPHKPFGPEYRLVTTDQVIQELRPKLAAIPGVLCFMQNPPPIQLGAHLTKSQYQYTLEGPDTTELYRDAQTLAGKISNLPGFQDVTTDLQIDNPQVNVHIDRDKASALGVTAEQIESALTTAYGGGRISTIYAPTNEYWVISELEPQYQMKPNDLSLLYLRSSSGKLVPLDTVAGISEGLGPLSVNHFGQLPSVTISFNLSPGTALGNAVSEVDRLARETVPADVSASFEGTAQQFQSSMVGLGVLLLATVLVIYLVLGVLYESFIHPITILGGLPSAMLGALVTLMLFHKELDLYAAVGVIMLVGIVKKNAIMMIDFALDAERNEGKPPMEAIYSGALVRFRPIMMTTFAALMGIMPIALGLGAGAESRRPLGLAVVGGLIFSQVVTLYITPVYYTYLDQFQNWYNRVFRGRVVETRELAESLPNGFPELTENGEKVTSD
jgi:HAE1 family hydrophobic/amphiphilic exporter-1